MHGVKSLTFKDVEFSLSLFKRFENVEQVSGNLLNMRKLPYKQALAS